MKFQFRFLVFIILVAVCSCARASILDAPKKEVCTHVNKWVDILSELNGGGIPVKLGPNGVLLGPRPSVYAVAKNLAPHMLDKSFAEYVGKPFDNLTKKEKKYLSKYLMKCAGKNLIYVAVAFTAKKGSRDELAWSKEIEKTREKLAIEELVRSRDGKIGSHKHFNAAWCERSTCGKQKSGAIRVEVLNNKCFSREKGELEPLFAQILKTIPSYNPRNPDPVIQGLSHDPYNPSRSRSGGKVLGFSKDNAVAYYGKWRFSNGSISVDGKAYDIFCDGPGYTLGKPSWLIEFEKAIGITFDVVKARSGLKIEAIEPGSIFLNTLRPGDVLYGISSGHSPGMALYSDLTQASNVEKISQIVTDISNGKRVKVTVQRYKNNNMVSYTYTVFPDPSVFIPRDSVLAACPSPESFQLAPPDLRWDKQTLPYNHLDLSDSSANNSDSVFGGLRDGLVGLAMVNQMRVKIFDNLQRSRDFWGDYPESNMDRERRMEYAYWLYMAKEFNAATWIFVDAGLGALAPKGFNVDTGLRAGTREFLSYYKCSPFYNPDAEQLLRSILGIHLFIEKGSLPNKDEVDKRFDERYGKHRNQSYFSDAINAARNDVLYKYNTRSKQSYSSSEFIQLLDRNLWSQSFSE